MTSMIAATVASENSATTPLWTLGAVAGWLAVSLVWMGVTLGAVYRRVDGRPGRAWIPVLRYVELAHVTQSNVVGTATVRVIAAAGLATWVGGMLTSGGAAVALAGLGVALVSGTVAWVTWIVQTRRLGLDHALPAGLPVLAAVVPALWAAVVGWGSMIRRGPTAPVPVPVAGDDAAVSAPPRAQEPAPEPGPESEPEPTPEPAPEPAPETAPDPEPAAASEIAPDMAPETAPIAIRRSRYADLASRDIDATGEVPVRRSRYASLAPRDIAARNELPVRRTPGPAPTARDEWTPPVDFAAHVEALGDVDAVAPGVDVAPPPAPAPPRASAPAARREESAWEAALASTGELARVDSVHEAAATPAESPAHASAEPPAHDAVPAEPQDSPPDRDPDPTGPVSPYMPGGVAAPPPAPTVVPTFEAPVPRPAREPAAASSPPPQVETPPTQVENPPTAPEPPARAPEPPARAPEPPPLVVAPSVATPQATDDDRTRVSTRQTEAWELVTSEGRTYRFDSATVLVGRVGGLPPTDGTPRLDLHDSTRTISKSHARLTLGRRGWSVEDLGSTNGTYLVDDAGAEAQVPADTPTPVDGRLILGDVEVEIRRREAQE